MRTYDDLKPFQVLAAKRVDAGSVALLLRPGAGKTAATLTGLKQHGAWPVLVVAPAQVVEADVWGKEAALWEHLEGLNVVPLVGTVPQRTAALREELAHVETISYESVFWLTETVNIGKRYRAIVFDELSKLKHPGTQRFRRLRAAAKHISVRVGLTGTPVGNHLLDFWGEMFMVGGEAPLGPRYTDFRDQYFQTIDYWERVWRLKCCPKCAGGSYSKRECTGARPFLSCACHQAAIADIQKRTAPWVYALSHADEGSLGIPPVVVNTIRREMPARVADMERTLLHNLTVKVGEVTLEVLNASAVAQKLRQMAGGAVVTDTKTGAWEHVHAEKLTALGNLLDELQGEPVLLFYWYRHELERLGSMLENSGRRWGRADMEEDRQKWDRGELEVLLAHPQSAGHGLNLQAGGHTVAWFTLPASHELWTQGNGRVARTGQTAPEVPAHVLLCGETDERLAGLLGLKGEVESALVEGFR